jgi:hypothetical protein
MEPIAKNTQPRKRKENIIKPVYSRGLITRNIVLSITNIGKNIKETLVLRLILKGNVWLKDILNRILVKL